MKYFGGCDVGSTYTKAVILDENGKLNLEGEDKEGYMGFPGLQLISAEDVFYGHLEYVTGNIR